MWGSRASRKTPTPRFTDFFTDFEKKTDCFAVYLKLIGQSQVTFKTKNPAIDISIASQKRVVIKKVPLWYFLTHFLEDIKELASFDIYNVFNFIMNIYKYKVWKLNVARKSMPEINIQVFSRRFNTKLVLFVINN